MSEINTEKVVRNWRQLAAVDRLCLERLKSIWDLLQEAKVDGCPDEKSLTQVRTEIQAIKEAKSTSEKKNHQLAQQNAALKVEHLTVDASIDRLDSFLHSIQNPNLNDTTIDPSLSSMMERLEKKYEAWGDDDDDDDDDDEIVNKNGIPDSQDDLFPMVPPSVTNFEEDEGDDFLAGYQKVDVSFAGDTDEEQICFVNALRSKLTLLRERKEELKEELQESNAACANEVTILMQLGMRMHVLQQTEEALNRLSAFHKELCEVEKSIQMHFGTEQEEHIMSVEKLLDSPNLILGHVPKRTAYTQTAVSHLQPVDIFCITSSGIPPTPGKFFHNIIGQHPLQLQHVRFHRLDIPEQDPQPLTLPAKLKPVNCFFLLLYKHPAVNNDSNTIDWTNTRLKQFIDTLPSEGQKMLIIVREQLVLNHNPLPLKWLEPTTMPTMFQNKHIFVIGNADHTDKSAWGNTIFNNKMYRDIAQHVREWCDTNVSNRVGNRSSRSRTNSSASTTPKKIEK